MVPSLLLSLLLLSFLRSEAQGIRLTKVYVSVEHNQLQEMGFTETSHGGVGEVNILCKDCSGNNRKLIMSKTKTETETKTKTETSTSSKNEMMNKGGRNEESFSVKSSPRAPKHTQYRQPEAASEEHYPDIVDIAGMDYSPARRKPPVHN